MNRKEFAEHLQKLVTYVAELRESGQKEYTLSDDAFANFNRLSVELGISREKVLWVYAMKHKDGIASYLNGHVSQRESVHGRILDLIVYLCLLDGMIAENEGRK